MRTCLPCPAPSRPPLAAPPRPRVCPASRARARPRAQAQAPALRRAAAPPRAGLRSALVLPGDLDHRLPLFFPGARPPETGPRAGLLRSRRRTGPDGSGGPASTHPVTRPSVAAPPAACQAPRRPPAGSPLPLAAAARPGRRPKLPASDHYETIALRARAPGGAAACEGRRALQTCAPGPAAPQQPPCESGDGKHAGPPFATGATRPHAGGPTRARADTIGVPCPARQHCARRCGAGGGRAAPACAWARGRR